MSNIINGHLAHHLSIITNQLLDTRERAHHYREAWRDSHQEIKRMEHKMRRLKARWKVRRRILEGRLTLLQEENKNLEALLAAQDEVDTLTKRADKRRAECEAVKEEIKRRQEKLGISEGEESVEQE